MDTTRPRPTRQIACYRAAYYWCPKGLQRHTCVTPWRVVAPRGAALPSPAACNYLGDRWL